MKPFIKAFLFFSAPLLLFLFLQAYIDPFQLIRKESDTVKYELKKKISMEINSRLYKLIEYNRDPSAVVILGDSRADQLKSVYFEELLDEHVQNLSFGGGTLPEVIQTFEEISKTKKIKQVYLGISFNLYNSKNSMNLVPEAIELKGSIISYLNSKYCIKATFQYSKALLLHENGIATIPFTKEEFWNYQLYSAASNFYRSYSYPDTYFEGLKKIADYCSLNKIKLIFFIPPTHVDLQNRIHDFKLDNEDKQFKEDIASLGDLYDFDYSTPLTVSRSNFKDPYHSIDSISKIVVREIVTGDLVHGRVVKKKGAFVAAIAGY